MIDSIFVAMSGMLGHQRGLNAISNNVANMNTPGFRGSSVIFADVFNGSAAQDQQLPGPPNRGGGVDSSRTQLDTQSGEQQQTGRDLDLFLKGEGFFIVQDEAGEIRYTRNGRFDIDGDEIVLVAGTQKLKVLTQDEDGQLSPMSVAALRTNAAKATTEVKFNQTLSSTASSHTIQSLTVFDAAGGGHTLQVVFTRSTDPGAASVWKISVKENGAEVGRGDLKFTGSTVLSGDNPVAMTLDLQGAGPTQIDFNFETASAVPIGDNSNLVAASQDGLAAGVITTESFDTKGVLQIAYSNGQTAAGPRLVLAQIRDDRGLIELGAALFAYKGTQSVTLRKAGDDLQVQAKSLELANVDLTQQFARLILTQRGYQASSQVMTTANDMLQELLQMRGGR